MTTLDPKIFTLSTPAISAMVALLIILFDVLGNGGAQRRTKLKLALFFATTTVTTCSALIYFYYPNIFLWINGLYMLSILSMPIFLYAFIFKITCTDKPEQFSNLHYLAPTVLAIFLIIVSLFTPVEEQMLTIKGNGAYNGGSRLFFYASNCKLFIRLIFSIVYILFIFKRLPKYRLYIVNYSSNESKSSLHWVPIYLLFMIGTIPIPLLGQFMPRDTLVSSGFAFIHVAILIVQHSFLAYHAVKENYILPERDNYCTKLPDLMFPEEDNTITDFPLKKSALTRDTFEHYIRTEKPYLNSELKITDLVDNLKINRSYISSFINTEYGINFSNYINMCRLREYENLRSCSKLTNISNTELVEMAGFGSYRSYLRMAKQEEKERSKTEKK